MCTWHILLYLAGVVFVIPPGFCYVILAEFITAYCCIWHGSCLGTLHSVAFSRVLREYPMGFSVKQPYAFVALSPGTPILRVAQLCRSPEVNIPNHINEPNRKPNITYFTCICPHKIVTMNIHPLIKPAGKFHLRIVYLFSGKNWLKLLCAGSAAVILLKTWLPLTSRGHRATSKL